jgi:hypothetical protein
MFFGPFPGPGFGGPGPDGPHFGAVVGTAALLLDGRADATQIVEQVSEATGGVLTPPYEAAEAVLSLLAVHGTATISDGAATLTDLGRNLLARNRITSDGTRTFLAQAAKFDDLYQIRRHLFEIATLGRSIAWTGTETQKSTLAEGRRRLLEALAEIKQSLHGALSED